MAVEVMEGVTKCQVASGEDAIKEKFNNGDKLVVILDKQGTAAGGFLQRARRCAQHAYSSSETISGVA
ncbi:MAG: hypothetical protein ACLTZY_02855 [Alistipes indistinctus]